MYVRDRIISVFQSGADFVVEKNNTVLNISLKVEGTCQNNLTASQESGGELMKGV